MASRAVGEVINGQMEVLSVGQSLDKRSGQTMLKTRVRFTSGPFKGIETLVKHPVSDGKKGSKSTAKSTASKPASNSKNTASKSTSKGAAKSTSKGAAKKSTGKAKQVKPADTTKGQDTEDDLEELDLDFEDDEE